MQPHWKEVILKDFNYLEKIEIFNFTGPNKTKIPHVLGIADRYSHYLFRGNFGALDTLLKDPKLVPINFNKKSFINRKKLFFNSDKQ